MQMKAPDRFLCPCDLFWLVRDDITSACLFPLLDQSNDTGSTPNNAVGPAVERERDLSVARTED